MDKSTKITLIISVIIFVILIVVTIMNILNRMNKKTPIPPCPDYWSKISGLSPEGPVCIDTKKCIYIIHFVLYFPIYDRAWCELDEGLGKSGTSKNTCQMFFCTMRSLVGIQEDI